MPIVSMMPVVVYGAYSVYGANSVCSAYGHNEILSIGLKWSCVLVTLTQRECSTTT